MLTKGDGIVSQDRDQLSGDGGRLKRQLAGCQFIEQDSDGIQIAAIVQRFTASLFGGQVARRSNHCA